MLQRYNFEMLRYNILQQVTRNIILSIEKVLLGVLRFRVGGLQPAEHHQYPVVVTLFGITGPIIQGLWSDDDQRQEQRQRAAAANACEVAQGRRSRCKAEKAVYRKWQIKV